MMQKQQQHTEVAWNSMLSQYGAYIFLCLIFAITPTICMTLKYGQGHWKSHKQAKPNIKKKKRRSYKSRLAAQHWCRSGSSDHKNWEHNKYEGLILFAQRRSSTTAKLSINIICMWLIFAAALLQHFHAAITPHTYHQAKYHIFMESEKIEVQLFSNALTLESTS